MASTSGSRPTLGPPSSLNRTRLGLWAAMLNLPVRRSSCLVVNSASGTSSLARTPPSRPTPSPRRRTSRKPALRPTPRSTPGRQRPSPPATSPAPLALSWPALPAFSGCSKHCPGRELHHARRARVSPSSMPTPQSAQRRHRPSFRDRPGFRAPGARWLKPTATVLTPPSAAAHPASGCSRPTRPTCPTRARSCSTGTSRRLLASAQR